MNTEIVQSIDNEALRELKSKFPDFDTTERENKFPIAAVPFLLYREVSKSLGIGEEFQITSNSWNYYMKKLNPDSPATGFNGAVGIRKELHNVLTFVLWWSAPNTNDTITQDPVLKISGGPSIDPSSSVVREKLWMHLDQYGGGFQLTQESKLIWAAIYRAIDLSKDPNCVSKEYWRKGFK